MLKTAQQAWMRAMSFNVRNKSTFSSVRVALRVLLVKLNCVYFDSIAQICDRRRRKRRRRPGNGQIERRRSCYTKSEQFKSYDSQVEYKSSLPSFRMLLEARFCIANLKFSLPVLRHCNYSFVRSLTMPAYSQGWMAGWSFVLHFCFVLFLFFFFFVYALIHLCETMYFTTVILFAIFIASCAMSFFRIAFCIGIFFNFHVKSDDVKHVNFMHAYINSVYFAVNSMYPCEHTTTTEKYNERTTSSYWENWFEASTPTQPPNNDKSVALNYKNENTNTEKKSSCTTSKSSKTEYSKAFNFPNTW